MPKNICIEIKSLIVASNVESSLSEIVIRNRIVIYYLSDLSLIFRNVIKKNKNL